MKKTPLQKLIEWMDKLENNPTPHSVKLTAYMLLEEEKQMVVDACNSNKGVNGWSDGEQYFNETFEQNN